MTTSVEEEPARAARFGQRYGCVVVVSFLGALVGSVIYAWRQPLPGIGLVAVLLGSGFWLMRYAAKREREEAAREVARLRAVAPPTGSAWRALLQHEGLGQLVEALGRRVRPALRLTTRPVADALALGQSRVGGMPDLPADLDWPKHQGLPMMFLAQLDLADVTRNHPASLFPATGHLWFFFSLAQPWGFDPKDAGGSLVCYRPDGVGLARAAPPGDLPDAARFPACAITFEAYEDLPDLEDETGAPPLGDDDSERYIGIREYLSSGGAGPSHKLLGFADPVQSPMELECQLVTNGIYCGDPSGYEGPRVAQLTPGQAEWRLLLQLDSDESARMMWGDAGRLYFWIRESDLREQRFDRAWLILQCH